MTLQKLYQSVDGNYDQALRVLRVEKLVDKHIRKLPKNGVIDELLAAGEALDPVQMFEKAHAAKGVCANLGLTVLAEYASELSEEFRPGNARRMTDEEVKNKINDLARQYRKTAEVIQKYEEA